MEIALDLEFRVKLKLASQPFRVQLGVQVGLGAQVRRRVEFGVQVALAVEVELGIQA